MARHSLALALVELAFWCAELVIAFLGMFMVPVGFVSIILFCRYYETFVGLTEKTISFVEDIVALAFDATDLVVSPFRTGYTHSPWSNIISTWTILQLLCLGCFVVVLIRLSKSHPLPRTRQSLEDLLDEKSRKFRATEVNLLGWQSFGERMLASNKELQEQNNRLQREKEQVIAEKDHKEREIAHSEEKIEHLTIDLDVANHDKRRLEKSRFTAAFSLQVAEKNADRWEQAYKAADEKVCNLTQETIKAKKRAAIASTKAKQSHEAPDHTDCLKTAASLHDQVAAQQKALKSVQGDQDDRLRKQASEIRRLREGLVGKVENQKALHQQIEFLKAEIDKRETRFSLLQNSLNEYGEMVHDFQAKIRDLENSTATQNASQQQTNTPDLTESLAAKDASLQKARAEIQGLEKSLTAKDSNLRQAQANNLSLAGSLTAKNNDIQLVLAHIRTLEESLAAKDRNFQQAQAEIQGLKESLAGRPQVKADTISGKEAEEVGKEGKYQSLRKEIETLTVQINDRQAKLSRAEASLVEKNTALQDAQTKIMDLQDQVNESNAAEGEAANPETAMNPETATEERQRHEIERLNREVSTLKAAQDSREAEPMDGDMEVDDDSIIERQSKEIADLQETIQGLRADLAAARSEAEEMEVEAHECDHTGCQQREAEQDIKFAQVRGRSLILEKQVSTLAAQVREKDFQMQNLRASIKASPPATTTASPDATAGPNRAAMNMEIAKLRAANADNLARAKRESQRAKQLEDNLRAKSLELKEVSQELESEKVAASTRVEGAIREKLVGANRAFDEMKAERDRCRANNADLLKRATEAEKALAESQRLRHQSGAETVRLAGEVAAVPGSVAAANPKKRELEEGEEEEGGASRAPKIGRPNSMGKGQEDSDAPSANP